MDADVLVGSDGIWSQVRAQLRDEPARGEGSGVTYSGYTVFAGELDYDSSKTPSDIGPDPACGYKVYIGPQQYFVITDIGRGRYQWYAFLSRPPGSGESEAKPDGSSMYLQVRRAMPTVHRRAHRVRSAAACSPGDLLATSCLCGDRFDAIVT